MSIKTQTGAMVYRFGDTVAMHTIVNPETGEPVESCPTIYLTEKMARELSKALLKQAQNIRSQASFANSTLSPIKIGNHE